MKKEFTASVYIMDQQKVLLIYHRKLQKWLPPGGHIEPNETPPEAACREALEETGLEIELIVQENVWIKCWNASSFTRPFLCLLEEIPPYKDQPAHQHMDMVYIARPIAASLPNLATDQEEIRWFTWDELNQLQPDIEIFNETLQVICHLFSSIQTVALV